MRILLIEDSPETARSVELMLKSEGVHLHTARSGEEGIDLGKLYDYDFILLGLNLPDINGADVLRCLRRNKVATPALVLSEVNRVEEKVKCLGAGADDYMTKPFHKAELVARIYAIVRRATGHAESSIRTGRLEVKLDDKSAWVGDRKINLTGKEFQMLELLSMRKGTTLTKDMFLNYLYSGMDEPELKIIDVFMCKIRKKIAAATGGENYIETVWGRGYVLRDPVEEENIEPMRAIA